MDDDVLRKIEDRLEALERRQKRMERNIEDILSLLRGGAREERAGGSAPIKTRIADGRHQIWAGEGIGWVEDWAKVPPRTPGR
jgi:hypothetical protein